jgi:hypothetical protein
MRKTVSLLFVAATFVGFASASAMAAQSLVRFDGGIGVIPVSAVNAAGQPVPNTVRGISPGGQPWVIRGLKAAVGADGRIKVDGRGLLLAGGNAIGTNGNQSVRAVLFCGTLSQQSGLVPLEADGDFKIDDVLTPTTPNPCDSPVLLIVSGAGRWFAAGIPQE